MMKISLNYLFKVNSSEKKLQSALLRHMVKSSSLAIKIRSTQNF